MFLLNISPFFLHYISITKVYIHTSEQLVTFGIDSHKQQFSLQQQHVGGAEPTHVKVHRGARSLWSCVLGQREQQHVKENKYFYLKDISTELTADT